MASRDPKNEREIALEIPVQGLPGPVAANWFQFARVGTDFQMLIGYIDLLALHRVSAAMKEGKDPGRTRVEVTHRVALSQQAIVNLAKQLNEIVATISSKEEDNG